jgi:hypothetical protein
MLGEKRPEMAQGRIAADRRADAGDASGDWTERKKEDSERSRGLLPPMEITVIGCFFTAKGRPE